MPVLAPVTTAAVGAGGGWGMDFPVRCQSIAARAFAPGPPAALARAGGAVLGAAAIAAVIAATIAAAATAFVRDRLRAISRASFSAGGGRCGPGRGCAGRRTPPRRIFCQGVDGLASRPATQETPDSGSAPVSAKMPARWETARRKAVPAGRRSISDLFDACSLGHW